MAEHSMTRRSFSIASRQQQLGAALLIFFILVFTASASVLLRALNNRSTDQGRSLTSTTDLVAAKEALLAFAIMASTNPDSGPGRLPCPDIDMDSEGRADVSCNTANTVRGRLPRIALDAAGNQFNISPRDGGTDNQLWYAVSSNYRFSEATSTAINASPTLATLSVDGSNDVVAVIIDAGAPLMTLTAPTSNAAHYLEGDNVSGTNFVSSLLAPQTFNDRLMVIRRAELMSLVTSRVAQKLQTALGALPYPINATEFDAKVTASWFASWRPGDSAIHFPPSTPANSIAIQFAGCAIEFTITPTSIDRSATDC